MGYRCVFKDANGDSVELEVADSKFTYFGAPVLSAVHPASVTIGDLPDTVSNLPEHRGERDELKLLYFLWVSLITYGFLNLIRALHHSI